MLSVDLLSGFWQAQRKSVFVIFFVKSWLQSVNIFVNKLYGILIRDQIWSKACILSGTLKKSPRTSPLPDSTLGSASPDWKWLSSTLRQHPHDGSSLTQCEFQHDLTEYIWLMCCLALAKRLSHDPGTILLPTMCGLGNQGLSLAHFLQSCPTQVGSPQCWGCVILLYFCWLSSKELQSSSKEMSEASARLPGVDQQAHQTWYHSLLGSWVQRAL